MLHITPELLLNYLGIFGPFTLIIITGLLLRHKHTYLIFFICGNIFNLFLNILLKLILKEPRPNNNKFNNIIGILYGIPNHFEVYGMPSGHAQACGFLLALVTYIFHNPTITCVYIFVTFLIMVERYLREMHSITQLIAGLFVGYSVGYITYILASRRIVGNIKSKPDDFAPK